MKALMIFSSVYKTVHRPWSCGLLDSRLEQNLRKVKTTSSFEFLIGEVSGHITISMWLFSLEFMGRNLFQPCNVYVEGTHVACLSTYMHVHVYVNMHVLYM